MEKLTVGSVVQSTVSFVFARGMIVACRQTWTGVVNVYSRGGPRLYSVAKPGINIALSEDALEC